MRAPSAILRSLSLRRIQPRAASAAVAPLPATTQFSRELAAELTALQPIGTTGGEHGMAQLLDAAITTQKIALNSLAQVSYLADVDRGAMEEYLETNTDILDACNYFVERIEDMKKYVESLRIVAHSCTNATTSRALDKLESCHGIEKRLKTMGKRGSCLRKTLLRQKLGQKSEFSEIVCGSKVMALISCFSLEHALSFDCSRGGFPMMKCHPMNCSWLRIMQDLVEGSGEKKKSRRSMIELQQTVDAARELKEQIKGKREKQMVEYSCVERVKRSCGDLEGGLGFIEGKVRDLYKSLIDVRMALLGILSQA
ncbi:hypothetical protein AAZX31_16G184500 [Glycine max]|uniref:Uncharacterized protein n=2 Tax=Glycine subgen. Soja TaxID=1462606 RepID=I1MQC1_SOYBN|nr:hypothetical protein JHK85_046491 [Glycine max]KHN24454.1 hypothetical protein glysoja_014058 [Glycine soja]KAG5100462.1 hypothetical protein JHK82_045514 [Glycine max]KAG5109052.1 hypothetical protein JHK84_045959 [Glycine max]KAH1152202.1 hypothetical protein GYH30_045624 [Glycine max]